jgi:hypothetical protein
VEWHRSQIFWVLNGEQATSRKLTQIIPTEILHLQLSPYTQKMQTDIMAGSYGKSAIEAGARPNKLSEAVVHSIGQMWYESYLKKSGHPITKDEQAKILNSTYPGVAELYKRLQDKKSGGIKTLINDYIDTPEKLYKETKL